MEVSFWIVCTPNLYKFDRINVSGNELCHLNINKRIKECKTLQLDCAFMHYFVRELTLSSYYRTCVIATNELWQGPDVLLLVPTRTNLLDYNWNERIYRMVRERCELDHALSWLSTLGGAFSALGDYFQNCADTAGRISLHQLKLALRLGDPNVQSRCRLYLSLSLIQKRRYKMAKNIIRWEYQYANSQNVMDERLVKMCKGIWAKLQYEHSLYKNNKMKLRCL